MTVVAPKGRKKLNWISPKRSGQVEPHTSSIQTCGRYKIPRDELEDRLKPQMSTCVCIYVYEFINYIYIYIYIMYIIYFNLRIDSLCTYIYILLYHVCT